MKHYLFHILVFSFFLATTLLADLAPRQHVDMILFDQRLPEKLVMVGDEKMVVWYNKAENGEWYWWSLRASGDMVSDVNYIWPAEVGDVNYALAIKSIDTDTNDVVLFWNQFEDANGLLPNKTPWCVMFVDANGYPLSEDPNDFTYYMPETAFGVGLDNIAEGTYANNYIEVYSLLSFDPNLYTTSVGWGGDHTIAGPNNVRVGYAAGTSLDSGVQNTLTGRSSGEKVVLRDDNSYYGYRSGQNTGGGGFSGAASYKYTYVGLQGDIWGVPLQDGYTLCLDNGGSAVNEGGGIVSLPFANNPFVSGDVIYILGTTNYEAEHTLTAGTTTSRLHFADTYNAETFDGTETVCRRLNNLQNGRGNITNDSGGNLYYSHIWDDLNDSYITVFETDHTVTYDFFTFDTLPADPNLKVDLNLAMNNDGDYLYLLTEAYAYKFDMSDGSETWAVVPSSIGYDMAIDENDNVYVSYYGSYPKQMAVLDPTDGSESNLTYMGEGKSLSIYDSGSVYDVHVDDELGLVMGGGHQYCLKSSGQGDLLYNFCVRTFDDSAGDQVAVGGYHVDGTGLLYETYNVSKHNIASDGQYIYVLCNGVMYKYSWDGSSLTQETTGTPPGTAVGLYCDHHGNLVCLRGANGISNKFYYYDKNLNALSNVDNLNGNILSTWSATNWNRGNAILHPDIGQIMAAGEANVAVGSHTLQGPDSGSEPNGVSVVGFKNTYNATTADEATSIGEYGLYSLTTGARDVALGPWAGYWLTTEDDVFVVDNQRRTNAADEILSSILYGHMAADANDQWLNINVGELNLNFARLDVNDVNISGDLTLNTFTQGSILFIGANGLVSEDNSNFFYNDSSNRLDIYDVNVADVLSLQGQTASRLLATDGSKDVVSTDLYSWISGTTNQVNIANDGDGTVTASTPQDIHTGASPTFAGMTITNAVNEFSTDGTMAGNSDSALPTEKAVKTYVDGRSGPGTGNIVWHEIRTDFQLLKKGGDPPGEESEAIGASGNILGYNYAFDPGGPADEEVFFHIVIPSDIDEEYDVHFFLGWWPDSGWGSGDYRWCLEYLVRDVDDMYGPDTDRTAGASTTIYEEVTPANTDNLIETAFYDPNTIDANKNQVIFCHLYLDSSESSADDDGHVYYAMFQYAVNTPGPTLGEVMLFEDGDSMVFESGDIMIYEDET